MEKYLKVNDGDFISIYTDNNIYKVFENDYGELCIDFRGEERTLKSFGNLLYKVYSDKEISEIGEKINE